MSPTLKFVLPTLPKNELFLYKNSNKIQRQVNVSFTVLSINSSTIIINFWMNRSRIIAYIETITTGQTFIEAITLQGLCVKNENNNLKNPYLPYLYFLGCNRNQTHFFWPKRNMRLHKLITAQF